MNLAIVDFQCLILSNQPIIKELCIARLDSQDSSHWIFTSPLTALSSSDKRTNVWLYERFHGLSWTYGEVPFQSMKTILEAETCCFNYLLVKGVNKIKILQDVLPSALILNIENLACPNFRLLRSLENVKCLYHSSKSSRLSCSKAQALSLRNWLKYQ